MTEKDKHFLDDEDLFEEIRQISEKIDKFDEKLLRENGKIE